MNRIKQLREENKITQEELAEKLDLSSKGIISMYEKEERKPSLEILVKLSGIFNCSIDYLLCKTDIRNPNQSEIPEVRVIERGAKNMNQKEREKMVNMVMAAFEEAFNEDSDIK